MNKDFIKYVENNDIVEVHSTLTSELLLRPQGDSFDEMIHYAEQKLPDLYSPDNGVEYPKDSSMWDQTLVNKIKNDLDRCFSKEKLSIYKEVVAFVLKEKIMLINQEETDTNTKSNHTIRANGFTENCKTIYKDNRKSIDTSITVAGTLALAGSFIVKGTTAKILLGTCGTLGLITGCCLLFKDMKK